MTTDQIAADEICILIVDWNSGPDVQSLIDRLVERGPHAIIVIDNGSSPPSQPNCESTRVSIIRLTKNEGYGAGMNVGLKEAARAGFEWAWLLNPDCLPDHDALHRIGDHASGAVALGCLQSTGPAATSTYSTAAQIRAGRLETIRCAGCEDGVHDADVLTGTGILLRVSEALRVGGFDTDFFHYKEEFDLTWRMRDLGRVRHVCRARVIHRRGGSLSHDSPTAAYYRTRNEYIYQRKHSFGLRRYLHFLSWTGTVLNDRARGGIWGRGRWKVNRYILYGIRDGWNGRKGKMPQ